MANLGTIKEALISIAVSLARLVRLLESREARIGQARARRLTAELRRRYGGPGG